MTPDPWKRLAAAAGPTPDEPCPAGFDTRAVARWRNRGAEEGAAGVETILQRALVCASLMALLSLALNWDHLGAEDANELALADSMIESSWLP